MTSSITFSLYNEWVTLDPLMKRGKRTGDISLLKTNRRVVLGSEF